MGFQGIPRPKGKSLQQDLALPLGLLPGGRAWKTSKKSASRRHFNQMPTALPKLSMKEGALSTALRCLRLVSVSPEDPSFGIPPWRTSDELKALHPLLGFLFIAEGSKQKSSISADSAERSRSIRGPRSKRMIEALRSMQCLVPCSGKRNRQERRTVHGVRSEPYVFRSWTTKS